MDGAKLALCIRKARMRHHMTQQDLAAALNVTNSAVSKWERGLSIPDVSLLVPLSRLLGLQIEDLLDADPEEAVIRHCEALSPDEPKEDVTVNKSLCDLKIDVANAAPVSPYLFGHNFEHTRATVMGGISAQMIRNRKFAGKPSLNQGVASKWFGIGEKMYYQTDKHTYTRHTGVESMRRMNELQAQSIMNLQEGQIGGIGQYDLPLKAGKTYEMRLITLSSRPVSLHVDLTDRSGNTVYAAHTLTLVQRGPAPNWELKPGDWQEHAFTLTAPADEPEGCLRIWFTEKAEVVLGAVSMLPQGHFRGMRRDVIQRLKEMGPSMLRWPGGNYAGEYRWMDGLLPVDQRAPLQAYMEIETQPFSDGYDYHEINTDDFIALCREVGAEPFITINLTWCTPEETANWVEYCNGDETTRYGKLRAERGFKEPYHVRFWSLGNEQGFSHMEGPAKAEGYAAAAEKNMQAMLAVSPDLEFCSSGPYPNDEWAVNSAARLAPASKNVSLHIYCHAEYDYTTPEGVRKTYQHIVNTPSILLDYLKKMRASLDKADPSLQISFDEWNAWYAWYRPFCVSEGLFIARTLHIFLQESNAYRMPISCYFQPITEGAIRVDPYESSLTAGGQMFAMMKAHCGAAVCPIEGTEAYEALASVKDGVLTVTLLNIGYDTEQTFKFNAGGAVTEATVYTAEDVLPGSRFTPVPLTVQCADGAVQTALPPHSAAIIRIKL